MSLGSVVAFVTGGLWSWLSPEGTAAWWSLQLGLGVKGEKLVIVVTGNLSLF